MGGHHPNLTSGATEADAPHSQVLRLGAERPLTMDAGVALAPLSIAYQTYGALNNSKTHAILVCHALPPVGQSLAVGAHARPGQPPRFLPPPRHLVHCRRGLHGLGRASVAQSRY